MAILARLKSLAGTGEILPVLPVSATPVISPAYSVFTVGGTTAITSFSTDTPVLPGRVVILMGTDATGPVFTDTAIGSTAEGKIHLSAALTLANGTAIAFVQGNNGSWWEVARAANG
jgi:hypothetical protein